MRAPLRSVLVLVTALSGSTAYADTKAADAKVADPISKSLSFNYERIKKSIVASAELVAEKDYAYKPTPEVRSFGQLIGHIANSQYIFCSAAKKEVLPKNDIEKNATTKAALQKALADAFAYCDPIYAGTTDASLVDPITLFGGKKMPKFAALDINVSHDNEHYGNLVTYMRLKGLVPPSSADHK